MSVCKNIFLLVSLILSVNLALSAEYVPVYMWSTTKTIEKVPALHKVSQDSFKDDVLERLKDNPFVVVFAEQTLSPEDFAQKDQDGKVVYTNLSKMKNVAKVTYLAYVQNPIKAMKHLDQEVNELSVTALIENLQIPESRILIVDLNDAKDEEHRLDMLRRHDADITTIYEEILKKHDNVLALYTAHHTSWVAPENVRNSRKIRSLLAAETKSSYFSTDYTILYYTRATFNPDKSASTNVTDINWNFTDAKAESGNIELTGNSAEGVEIVFTFTSKRDGYWYLGELVVTHNGTTYNMNTSISDVYGPNEGTLFSYHCGDQVFTSKNFEIYISSFQVQPFFAGRANTTKFSDAYDCVGFTSVPIWSGIFVTSILLLIMTFGIIMMMDIRTMDRFDDAKGKTITINAE